MFVKTRQIRRCHGFFEMSGFRLIRNVWFEGGVSLSFTGFTHAVLQDS
jgi:hypothetical protein